MVVEIKRKTLYYLFGRKLVSGWQRGQFQEKHENMAKSQNKNASNQQCRQSVTAIIISLSTMFSNISVQFRFSTKEKENNKLDFIANNHELGFLFMKAMISGIYT